jgi:hypothetical protein
MSSANIGTFSLMLKDKQRIQRILCPSGPATLMAGYVTQTPHPYLALVSLQTHSSAYEGARIH